MRTFRSFLILFAQFVCSTLLADQVLLKGTAINCVINKKTSSTTEKTREPIGCNVVGAHSFLPAGSTIIGHLTDYKDPGGNFYGGGYMELTFNRIAFRRSRALPLTANVVDVKGYAIDKRDKIHNKVHLIGDVVEGSIPILWPVDVITAQCGPCRTLKAGTRLKLVLVDDLVVPNDAFVPQRYGYRCYYFNSFNTYVQ